jgi:hypothetical protein
VSGRARLWTICSFVSYLLLPVRVDTAYNHSPPPDSRSSESSRHRDYWSSSKCATFPTSSVIRIIIFAVAVSQQGGWIATADDAEVGAAEDSEECVHRALRLVCHVAEEHALRRTVSIANLPIYALTSDAIAVAGAFASAPASLGWIDCPLHPIRDPLRQLSPDTYAFVR